jgi:exodeoxyribonuclease VII small subunit
MAAKKISQAAPTGYAEAMTEIESILSQLDSSSIDVDVLATKVERASFLITWCNERITAAQLTVDTLVADIEFEESDFDDDDDDDDEDDEDE